MSLVAASGLYAPHVVSADQLSDLRAQAQALAARIQSLGQQEDALSEQYDAAQIAVQDAQNKVNQAAAQVASANAAATKAKQALSQEAVDAYTRGGNSLTGNSDQSLTSANNSLLRAEYADSLATTQSDSLDSYRLAAVQARTAQANLTAAQQAATTQLNKLGDAKTSVQGTQTQLQGAYQQDQGQIAALVQQIQQEQAAAAAAAAQKAAQERAAAQAAAAQQAQAQQAAAQQSASRASSASSSGRSGGSSGGSAPAPAPSYSPPPPVGSGASGAVAAAESRVGDPYVWGASGPSSFDCSGLMMWAYEQVGISLPHYSGAQYSDGTQIPISEVQPGDLVFPSDPGQHVAMYVGNGQIVEAPYTGATVHVVPMSSWFVLATRIA